MQHSAHCATNFVGLCRFNPLIQPSSPHPTPFVSVSLHFVPRSCRFSDSKTLGMCVCIVCLICCSLEATTIKSCLLLNASCVCLYCRTGVCPCEYLCERRRAGFSALFSVCSPSARVVLLLQCST